MVNQYGAASQAVRLDTQQGRLIRLKKGVMTTARLVNDRLSVASIRWRPVMVTLTYADADAWLPDHISAFINRVQMFAKRRGYKLPYVWVMELQKRGAPHYHVLFWIPARLYFPKADRRGWWSFGSTRIDRVKNAVGYVAKYASKLQSKDGAEMPKGARIHGVGGITKHEARVVSWWKLPKDMRQGEEGSIIWRRKKGGGWFSPDTGEIKESEWGLSAVCTEGKTVLLVKKPAVETIRPSVDWVGMAAKKAESDFWKQAAESINRSNLLATNRVGFLIHVGALGFSALDV